jgi:23S rRNA (uracil1939-C5)-methyltransferase
VLVTALGAEADGIAQHPDGTRLFVAGALPGERVRVVPTTPRGDGWAAAVAEVTAPSTARVAPVCRHFGACGGCVLQHWAAGSYGAWKRDLLSAALRRAGYADPLLLPTAQSHPGERRRMDLAVRRSGGGVVLGLHRARAAEVVDLLECHVLAPALTALLPSLRAVLGRLLALRRTGSVVANLLDSGPDLLLRTDAALGAADRGVLAGFARPHGVARIAWALGDGAPETACLLAPPRLTIAGAVVTPPPGAFLQATRSGEAAIVAAVMAGLAEVPASGSVAELYAGCGTLSFPLTRHWRVTAWEGDAAAVAALREAANHGGLAGRLTAQQRDLARQPPTGAELSGFSAVVLDPPAGGAADPIRAIAASTVSTVVYVSCDPASLGRDAGVLRAGGYRLRAVQPVDQFVWSARLEAVACFVRA